MRTCVPAGTRPRREIVGCRRGRALLAAVAAWVLLGSSGAGATTAPKTSGATAAPEPAAGHAPSATGVTTDAASAVGYGSARLNGAINPAGQPTTYYFEYGTTAKYGAQSLPATIPGGHATISVSSPIAGLAPVTRYHYRLVAFNASGSALGADATFTTTGDVLSLELAALPSSVAFGAPVSLVGHLNGSAAANREVVLQENPYPFTAGFKAIGNPQLTTAEGAFQFNLISLPVTTQFLVVTVGPGQPVSGTLTVPVQLAVTARVVVYPARRGYSTATFTGLINPAEVGARVSVERLVAGVWHFLVATNSGPATAAGSRYAASLRLRHGGYYRVSVRPVEDSHILGWSPAALVHASVR